MTTMKQRTAPNMNHILFSCVAMLLAAPFAAIAAADRPMALLSDNIAEGGSSLLFPKGTAVIPTGATHAFVTTGEYATCKGTLDSTAPHGGAKVLFDGREGWKSQTFGDWDGGAWTTVRIDLKKICLVGKVEIRALREALRDTERADVLFSLDGETFLQHGIAENKTAGAGGKDNFIPLTAVFETPVQARHVELRIRKARHQQQIGEIAIWGWLASDDPKANFIPAGEKPKVAFSARPIQDGAAQISWTEFARQAKGVVGWRIYHARQSFARVDEPGVTLLREFKAGQTSAAVYPFEPGSTVYFGITALYPEGESPSVQAAPLRFRTPFERNTFGDMLAINHFIGGGAKSRGQAWDEVSLDMLAETPFRESRWWFMFPETVTRFLDRGVGMVTWPIVDSQPIRHNIRNANALGLHAFSKGNEPELKGVSPVVYLEGLKKEYAAAKALSPWNTLGAPTCNIWPTALEWLEAFYRAGAKDYFDVLDLHTYTTPPEDLFGRIQRVREIMAEHGDADKPIISTEFGYADTPEGPEGVTPLVQAQYLARGLVIHYVLGFKRVYVYSFFDIGNDPHYNEHHFGLLDYDLQRKPAYHAVCNLGRVLGDCDLEGKVEGLNAPDYGYRFKTKDADRRVLVVWNAEAERLGTFSTAANQVEIIDMLGRLRKLALGESGRFSVPFGPSPVYIRSEHPVTFISAEAFDGPEGESPSTGKVAFELDADSRILAPGATSADIGVAIANDTADPVSGSIVIRDRNGKVLQTRKFDVGAHAGSTEKIQTPIEFPGDTVLVQCMVVVQYTARGASHSDEQIVTLRQLTPVASGETATRQVRFEHHDSDLWVIANAHVELCIDPKQGGRVLEFIDRKTLTNQVRIDYDLLPTLASLAHSYAIWFTLDGKGRNLPWSVMPSPPGSLLLNAPEEMPVSLRWTVDAASPTVTLHLLARNPSPRQREVRFQMHPEYRLGGRAESGEDILLFPTTNGVFKLPFWIDLGERPAPALSEDWWAVADEGAGLEMRQTFSKGWDPPRIWFGGGFYNVEMSRPLVVPPGGDASAWLNWTISHINRKETP